MNLVKIRFSELKSQTGEIETSFRDVFCFCPNWDIKYVILCDYEN